MKVSVIRSHDDVLSVDLPVSDIKSVLAGLKFQFGEELTDDILNNQYKYVLMREDDPESAIALSPEVLGSSFEGYDTLIVARDIEGSGEWIAIAIGGALATTTAAGAVVLTTAGMIVAAVINIAISIGLSFLMSALSPTPEFASDPTEAQKKTSALFNGAPIIREQGGIVPWVFGAPYCGGVLISSGVSSEDF